MIRLNLVQKCILKNGFKITGLSDQLIPNSFNISFSFNLLLVTLYLDSSRFKIHLLFIIPDVFAYIKKMKSCSSPAACSATGKDNKHSENT